MKINLHNLPKFLSRWNLEYDRVLHGFKTALGCLLGIGLYRYFDWPNGQWVPITIMVVMSSQTNFGGALQKAYMRFLGTVAGITITTITLLAFGDNIYWVFAVVFFAGLGFTYIASSGGPLSYAGTLGGVTLILTLTSAQTNIYYALTRGCYIIIGIVIALLVSRFCFPIHARKKLRLSVISTLLNLHRLYHQTIRTDLEKQKSFIDDKIDNAIMASLAEQPQLIEEAAIGSRYFNIYKKQLFVELVKTERRIYRLIYFMQKNLDEAHEFNCIMHEIGSLESLLVIIEATLLKLADSMEKVSMLEISTDMFQTLEKIGIITSELPHEVDAKKMLSEYSFVFLVEQILKELGKMQHLIININIAKNNEKAAQI